MKFLIVNSNFLKAYTSLLLFNIKFQLVNDSVPLVPHLEYIWLSRRASAIRDLSKLKNETALANSNIDVEEETGVFRFF